MFSYFIPPMIEQKLCDLGADLKVAFQPLALIDILLAEDVAYYIFINEQLRRVSSAPTIRRSNYSKILNTYLHGGGGSGIQCMFDEAVYGNEIYTAKLARIYDMVKNVPFRLGITMVEQEELTAAHTVEDLPRWFKDHLITPPCDSNTMISAVDTTQYNLFVLRPVDDNYCKVELIGAAKAITDRGEYLLKAVDTSIRDFLQVNTYDNAIRTGLIGLFTKLSSSYPLL